MAKKVVANSVIMDRVVEAISNGQDITIPTKGRSMLPFIVGERDTVTLGEAKDIAVGDIVVARYGENHFVLHRVIIVDNDDVTLMGDGNIRGVEHIKRKDIIAKVKFIDRKGKTIVCDSKRHQRQALLWRKLLPIRRYIIAIYSRAIGVR